MNVLFDKAAYEKARTVKNEQNNEVKESEPIISAEDDGKVIEDTIRNSIQSAKLGALTVDPGYLHFRTLKCMLIYFKKTGNRKEIKNVFFICFSHSNDR